MPSLQPLKLTVQPEQWDELSNQLNFLVKDIYSYLDELKGIDDRSATIYTGPTYVDTPPTYEGLTASRLMATNADNEVISTDLASWLAGTDDQLTATDDGDGTMTLSLPDAITLVNLTVTDITIGANKLDTNEWAFLDGQNQALKIADSPTFGGLTLAGDLALAANSIIGTSVHINNAELQQLSNIGATTISIPQWGYLGACGAGGGQLLAALTTGESSQLEAIGDTTTINAAQWAYLGAMDQDVGTGDDVTFNSITGSISPASPFTISSYGTDSQTGLIINTYNDQTAYENYIQFNKSHSDTDGAIVETPNGTELGAIYFRGVNSTPARAHGFHILARQAGVAGGTFVPTNVLFETFSDTKQNDDQFVLHHDGGAGFGTAGPDQLVELYENEIITGNVADGYAACLVSTLGYTHATGNAWTISRHNYINLKNPVGTCTDGGSTTITAAAVMRFNAAIGTHKAVLNAFQTTDSGAHTTNWAAGIIVNINGTLYKIPVIAV